MSWLTMAIISIHIAWLPNKEVDLAHYKAYQSLESECYEDTCQHRWAYDNIQDTTVVIPYHGDIANDMASNYIVVTALDTAGNESNYSNEVIYTPLPEVVVDSIPSPIQLDSTWVDNLFVRGDSTFATIALIWDLYDDTLATSFKIWDVPVEHSWEPEPPLAILHAEVPISNQVYTYMVYYEAGQQRKIRAQAANRHNLAHRFFSPFSAELGYVIGPTCVLIGDVNQDGRVNVNDLITVIRDNGKTGAELATDLNNDGKVNITDIIIVINNNGRICQ